MKLLIGGKNRNIHFRKDKSAFYKSNGEEHDVSKLFKKVGGLKKQYEEYLVSDNDLTERYKALSISGGSSSNASKKKPVPYISINKKKRKGKKFVGGMTVAAINIDIDAGNAPIDVMSTFSLYMKLIGAYYLALLSDSEKSIFSKDPPSPELTKNFHKNKLNNLLIIDFMTTQINDAGLRYEQAVFEAAALANAIPTPNPMQLLAAALNRADFTPYLPYTNETQNLVFCYELLKRNNAEMGPVDGGAIIRMYDAAIVAANSVLTAYNPAAAPVPVAVGAQIPASNLGKIFTAAGQGNPFVNIITQISEYRLPNQQNIDVATALNTGAAEAEVLRVITARYQNIKAQFYRYIVADIIAGTGAIEVFIQNNLDDPAPGPALEINDDDAQMILAFEDRYVIAGGIVERATAVGNGGAGIVGVANYSNELKKLPYELFEKLISKQFDQIAGANISAVAPHPELKNAYYNSIQANVLATVDRANQPGGVATAGFGLFSPSIP